MTDKVRLAAIKDEFEAKVQALKRRRDTPFVVPITLDDLIAASSQFNLLERRGSFYDMTRQLVQAGYDVEGSIL